ncbi:SpoIID/LytB domain-containing protein [Candidatus Omnitrophota bacterium]
MTLRIKGPYRMVDFKTGKSLREGKNLVNFTVSSKDIDPEGIKVLPEERTRVYINGRQFRGLIDISKDKQDNLLIINHIDLEEYLYGVLYHEVSHRWPIEVLKAQAIAARTYALYQKLVSQDEYFDLTSDVYSQVYGGRSSETWRTTRAVNLTRGRVLISSGKIFPSYYHATCGGHTSRASTIWDIDAPVLQGKVCNFCKASPHYEWKKELDMEYIQKRVQEAGYKIQVVSMEALERDPSGRILEVALNGKNSNVGLKGNEFRLLVGPDIIKSTNFEIRFKGKYVIFEGKGWGHGVGMCQWGAYYMARSGWNVDEILEYYYSGAEIASVGAESQYTQKSD